jgi:hypothetical protein
MSDGQKKHIGRDDILLGLLRTPPQPRPPRARRKDAGEPKPSGTRLAKERTKQRQKRSKRH